MNQQSVDNAKLLRETLALVRFRHAKGFGDYVRATSERPHPVHVTYDEPGATFCAECSFPVVAMKDRGKA